MSRRGGGGHVPGVGILVAGCPVGVASYYSARRASDVDGIKAKEGPTFQADTSRRSDSSRRGDVGNLGSHDSTSGGTLVSSRSDRVCCEDPRGLGLAGDVKMIVS